MEVVMALRIGIEQDFAGRCIYGSWDCRGYLVDVVLLQNEEPLCY